MVIYPFLLVYLFWYVVSVDTDGVYNVIEKFSIFSLI